MDRNCKDCASCRKYDGWMVCGLDLKEVKPYDGCACYETGADKIKRILAEHEEEDEE